MVLHVSNTHPMNVKWSPPFNPQPTYIKGFIAYKPHKCQMVTHISTSPYIYQIVPHLSIPPQMSKCSSHVNPHRCQCLKVHHMSTPTDVKWFLTYHAEAGNRYLPPLYPMVRHLSSRSWHACLDAGQIAYSQGLKIHTCLPFSDTVSHKS